MSDGLVRAEILGLEYHWPDFWGLRVVAFTREGGYGDSYFKADGQIVGAHSILGETFLVIRCLDGHLFARVRPEDVVQIFPEE